MKKENHKKYEVKFRKGNYLFLVGLAHVLSTVFLRKRVKKVDKDKYKFPCIILFNHTSNVDSLVAAPIIYPKPMSLVVTEKLFFEKAVTKTLITSVGYIPKKQFTVDIECIRNIKRYLSEGVSVGIFPDAKVSIDGTNNKILPAITKLLKLLKVPVLSCKLEGCYISFPRWTWKLKFTPLHATLSTLFDEQQLKELSHEEMYNKICESLKFDDGEYQINKKIKVLNKKRAESLNTILYRCPHCGKEFDMETKKDQIKCLACGKSYTYTRYGQILSNDDPRAKAMSIKNWYNMQKESLRQEIAEMKENGTSLDYEVISSRLDLTIPHEAQRELPTLCRQGKYSESIYKDDCVYCWDGEHIKYFDCTKLITSPTMKPVPFKRTQRRRFKKINNRVYEHYNDRKYGYGKISITDTDFLFDGVIDGEHRTLDIKLSTIGGINFMSGERVEIYLENEFFYFFTPKSTKIALAVDLLLNNC